MSARQPTRTERVLGRTDPVCLLCALGIAALIISFILGCLGIMSW